jgi:hypothetical protein
MNRYLITLILLIFLSGVYYLFRDSLPPRNAYKVSRLLSGLNISRKFELVKFEENWNENGDGVIFIEFKLTEIQIQDLIKENTLRGYKSLPTLEPVSSIYVDIFETARKGFYKLERESNDPESSKLIVIDTVNSVLIVSLISS